MRNRVVLSDVAQPLDVEDIRPIQDFVLLEDIERERSVGGVLLPKSKGTEIRLCRVVKAGNGLWNDAIMDFLPMDLKPGDVVVTIEYFADLERGSRLEFRSGKYRLVRSHGIWAKVVLKDAASYEILDIEPRFTAVLCEPHDETTTRGGIFLPNAQDKMSELRRATIVKTGPGIWNHKTAKRMPLPYSPGDKVLMLRYAGSEIEIRGKTLRLLHDDDIRSGWEE